MDMFGRLHSLSWLEVPKTWYLLSSLTLTTYNIVFEFSSITKIVLYCEAVLQSKALLGTPVVIHCHLEVASPEVSF